MFHLHDLFAMASWQWGFWHPTSHLGFEVLGYLASFHVYRSKHLQDILKPEQRKALKWWTLGGAILGAKAVPVLELMGASYWWAALISGKSLAGGLLGGIVGSELGKKRLGIKASTGDVLVWPLLWGSIVGRLGCASAAVFDGMLGQMMPSTWGEMASAFGVGVFASPALIKQAQPFFKKAIHSGYYWNMGMLEIMGLMAIMGLIYGMQTPLQKRFRSGALFYVFGLSYFVLRMGLDLLKHGHHSVSVVQVVSLLGAFFSLYQLFRLRLRQSAQASTP
jgi:phosphatidylglycerol:prolipoprotein diacylglycerol transferase